MNDDEETTKFDTDHYFTAQPQARSRPEQFTVLVREVELTLTSDRGVFSHGRLDDGTLRLLKKMELPRRNYYNAVSETEQSSIPHRRLFNGLPQVNQVPARKL